MLFNSVEFIVFFLPITLALFYFLKAKGLHRFTTGFLVVASLFFYGWWNPSYLILIIISMGANFHLAKIVSNQKHKPRKKLLLVGGIAFNLSAIAYFKYMDFMILNVNHLFGYNIEPLGILLPIAISFFTFQQIAYLVDAYSDNAPDDSFLHYCLFVTFFPQLIAGPIVHHREIMPQYDGLHKHQKIYENLALGLFIFSVGLFKKVMVADNLALYANPVFLKAETVDAVTFVEAWEGTLAYTFQLYFDFSGYSDMAIGLGKMFGLNLPVNFYSPYKAASIIDFWKKWHITLSRFFRDYLYIPLGGNRNGMFKQFLYLNITMVLCGLWHGAGWTFVLWGALHGGLLTINHIYRRTIKGTVIVPFLDNFAYRWFCHVLTFICVVFAWALFRAETLDGAINVIRGLVGMNGVVLPETYIAYFSILGIDAQQLGIRFVTELANFHGVFGMSIFIALFFVCKLMPNTADMANYYAFLETKHHSTQKNERRFYQVSPSFFWALFSAVTLFLAFTYVWMGRYSDFLYFQF